MIVGPELRVVWANLAAAKLFDGSGYETLQRRLVGGPAARRFGELLRSLQPGAQPRLDRLRFAWGIQVRTFTVLCGRAEDIDGQPALALSFLGPEADRVGKDLDWGAEPSGGPIEGSVLPAAVAVASAEDPIAATIPVSESPAGLDPTPQPVTLDEQRDRLVAALGGTSIGRFAWRSDASGALVQIDEPLMHRLGLPLVCEPDRSFAEQVADFDSVAAEKLQDVLAERGTWSGFDLLCPVFDGHFSLPIHVAASPQFDARREFQGFRGFGKVDLSRLHSREHEPALRLDETEPSPTMAEDLASAPDEPAIRDAYPAAHHLILPHTQDSYTETPWLPDRAPLSTDPEPELAPAARLQALLDETLPGGAFAGSGGILAAEATGPVLPAEAEAPVSPFERSANVVQLWPIHSAMLGRPSPSPVKATAPEGGGVDPSATSELTPEVGDVESWSNSLEAAVVRSPERKGGLSSMEHQAFQEIGRALGPGPRRMASATTQDDSRADRPQQEPPRAAESDLARHAAALVEHMAAGLLVMRQKKVLFANEALREALCFESHSELLDALALHFARTSPLDEPAAMLTLPSAYGDAIGFATSSRPILWNEQPANLWTLALRGDAEASSVVHQADVVPAPQPIGTEGPDFAVALDAAGEGIAVIDRGGLIVRLNRSAERLLGTPRGQGVGESLVSQLPAESRTTASALLDQMRSDPRPDAEVRADCIGRAPDGSPRALEMRIARLDPARCAVVWRDLSMQRGLERDLAQARRQISRASDQQPDFLAGVSHQIRTPLNAILGFAEIMMDERFGPLGNPRYKDYLKDMHASGTQVIAMVDDLTDLSRIETGKLDLHLGAIDINKIIIDCVAEAHALAHRERIIVRTSFSPRLPPVLVDERSARQIVGNLLSNAIKYNEPGGQVIVSTASHDTSTVVVRIRDTGIGMSDKEIATALEPFRQLAPAKTGSGTGLGLPLTKALATANGASLSMRSRPNEGTMVEVTFQATVSVPSRMPA